jgi:hypothetical protein
MLEQAGRQLAGEPEAVQRNLTLVQGDMRRFSLDRRFDFVFLGFNSILHLLSADDQIGTFTSVRQHLTPGGRFIVDVFNPTMAILADAVRPSPQVRIDLDKTDTTTGERLIRSTAGRYYDAEQRTQVRYFYERFGADGGYSKNVVDATFHTVFPRELELLFRMTGFTIEATYGDYIGDPFAAGCPRMIMVGRAA